MTPIYAYLVRFRALLLENKAEEKEEKARGWKWVICQNFRKGALYKASILLDVRVYRYCK